MNVKKIIQNLGGGSDLARELGLTRQAIYHWDKVNHIPRSWEMFLRKIHPAAFASEETDLH